jgi:hypothetical protein
MHQAFNTKNTEKKNNTEANILLRPLLNHYTQNNLMHAYFSVIYTNFTAEKKNSRSRWVMKPRSAGEKKKLPVSMGDEAEECGREKKFPGLDR